MKRVRLSAALLVVWLLLFFIGPRWLGPQAGLSRVAEVVVAATAAMLLLVDFLRQVRLWVLLGGLIGLVLALEWVSGTRMSGATLPSLTIEMCAVVLTALLARGLSSSIAAFEQAVMSLAIGRPGERRARQGEVYREIQRARLHQRPLAVLTVRLEARSGAVAWERIVEEMQQSLRQQYLWAGLSRALRTALAEDTIIAKSDDHFLVILPETTKDALPDLAKRLRQACLEQAGVSVQIGAACLPTDATTLEGLVHKATGEMQADLVAVPAAPQAAADAGFGSLAGQEADGGPLDRQ